MLKKQFDDFMATSQRNHEAFIAQQESSYRSFMNGAITSMNARSTAASDWVDYALDQQTVTGSGGTVKVSSAYTHTWSNGMNEWYQNEQSEREPKWSSVRKLDGEHEGEWQRPCVLERDARDV